VPDALAGADREEGVEMNRQGLLIYGGLVAAFLVIVCLVAGPEAARHAGSIIREVAVAIGLL
jgi:hypothetical protein